MGKSDWQASYRMSDDKLKELKDKNKEKDKKIIEQQVVIERLIKNTRKPSLSFYRERFAR